MSGLERSVRMSRARKWPVSSRPCAISSQLALPPSRTNGGSGSSLPAIGLGLGGADRPARLGADRDQIIVGAAHGAAVEVEAEPELGQQQQLVAHQRRAPSARRRRRFDRIEQAFERGRSADRAGLRAARPRSAPSPIRSPPPAAARTAKARGCGPARPSLAEAGCRSAPQGSPDDIAGHQHRPHAPAPGAAHIGRLEPMLRRHQPHHRAMLAVAAQRADNGLGLDPHQPRGWK